MEPSGPAPTARSRLRRVTFDLTGFPPRRPGENAGFLADGARRAKERVVDRLLADPDFGERWARRWLDLMRYAETKAHEFDYPILNAWQYRDYVVRAFDADVPYDGDGELSSPATSSRTPRLDPLDGARLVLGTGALAARRGHGEEARGDQTDRVSHQVEVEARARQALGVSRARCHDHKFDPISAATTTPSRLRALNTAPRQARFETDGRTCAVANEIRALEREGRPRAAVAAALRDEADARGALPRRARGDPEDGRAPARRRVVWAVASSPSRALEHVTTSCWRTSRPRRSRTMRARPWTRDLEAFEDRCVRARTTRP